MYHSKGIKKSIKYLPNCSINEPFVTALRVFETCVLVNNNFCRKLVSSLESPIISNNRFKVTSVLFSIPDFNLLSCELDNFIFKVNILSHFILILYLNKITLQYSHVSMWKI